MSDLTTLVQYPLDITGTASTNYVQGEQHTVTESNYRDYYFIVPTYAPFYTKNFAMRLINLDGSSRALLEGEDFDFALPYLGATRSIGIPIYGAITLNNTITSGIVVIAYQTLGGEYIADQSKVLETLAELVYNPRTTTWDQVTSKPVVFPPINHSQQFDTIYGQQALINSIDTIKDAIVGKSGTTIKIVTGGSGSGGGSSSAMEIALFPDKVEAGIGDTIKFNIITRSLAAQIVYYEAVYSNSNGSVSPAIGFVETTSDSVNGVGEFNVVCQTGTSAGTSLYIIARANNSLGEVIGVSPVVTLYDVVIKSAKSGSMEVGNTQRNGLYFTSDVDSGIANPSSGDIQIVSNGEVVADFNGSSDQLTFNMGSSSFVLSSTGFELQTSSNLKSSDIATKADLTAAVTNLVGVAPAALDQIAELANAIGNDPNFVVTVMNAIAKKADAVSYSYVQQGTGVGQLPDTTVAIGYSGTSLKATAGGVDLGSFIMSSNLSSIASTYLKRDGSVPMTGKLDTAYIDSNSAINDLTSSLAVHNNAGTGDAGLAAVSFQCGADYGLKLHLRADGYFGFGGGNRAAWSWYSDAAGNTVAAGNVSAYSDPRLKDDMTLITSALDKVNQLNGYTFKWNERSELVRGKWGKQDIGLSATEVKAVFPEVVTASLRDSKNNETYDTVAYDKLVPVLIEAIKELSGQVKTLQAELSSLRKVS